MAGSGLRQAVTDAELTARFAGLRMLLAYGLLGELVAAMAPLGLDYMGAQAAWLRGLGLDVAVVPLPTAAAVAENAARLAEVIGGAARDCVLVAHSKGGLEGLAALLAPAVAARCRGFVALQSPFGGSPVADALLQRGPLRAAAQAATRMLGIGSGEGLVDLTTPVRSAWMAAHAEAVAALTTQLPVVCLATVLEPATASPADRRYLPLANWVAARAGPNDGLVPVASALLPGAGRLCLPASHRGTVSAGKGRDPVGVLRQVLAALP